MQSVVSYPTSNPPAPGGVGASEILYAGSSSTDPPAGFDSLGRSGLAHPFLVALIFIVGLVLGSAAGYTHPVSYTADAHLIVGRVSGLQEDEVPGLAAAVQGLAQDYARLASSSNVVSETKTNLHRSQRSGLPGTVSASAEPESSIIDLQATASNEATAVRLANASAKALDSVVVKVTNDSFAQLKPILGAYQKADTTYNTATVEVGVLQAELDDLESQIGGTPPSAAQTAEESSLDASITQWQSQADTAKVQADAYLNQYDSALPPLQEQQEMIQQVGSASFTSSNQKPYIEVGALAGAVGGLIVGLALASLIDARRGRRALSLRTE